MQRIDTNQNHTAQNHTAQTTLDGASRTEALADRLAPLFAAVARRQLASSLLLLVASHRPVAFFSGQLLYMGEPLCALMGVPGSSDLAELLSRPDGIGLIESRLLAADEPAASHAMPQPADRKNGRCANVLE